MAAYQNDLQLQRFSHADLVALMPENFYGESIIYSRPTQIWWRFHADLVAARELATQIWWRSYADLVALSTQIWWRSIYRTESSQKCLYRNPFTESESEFQKGQLSDFLNEEKRDEVGMTTRRTHELSDCKKKML